MSIMKIKCRGDEILDVDVAIAEKFDPIATYVATYGEKDDGEPFVLKISCEILKKVVEWMDNHRNDPEQPEPDDFKEQRTLDLSEWDQNFLSGVDLATLHDLISAADYLNIQGLLDVTCKHVADMVRGKEAEEVRKIFNIENDIPPEEEEKLRKENSWCSESSAE